MPDKKNALSDTHIRALIKRGADGLYAVGGVAGLSLQIKAPANTSWILRTVVAGKRRYIGLGGYPEVSLAMARDSAREIKAKVRQGIDPIAEKRTNREALAKQSRLAKTFREVADDYIKVKSETYDGKNVAKQVQKLTNQLETYAHPFIGKLPISEVSASHLEQLFMPIWLTKRETATRVRIHIEKIIDRAINLGLYAENNPAKLNVLRELLPEPKGKLKKKLKATQRPTLPHSEMPRFFAHVSGDDTVAGKALMFQILCASRPSEVRYAKWTDIDLKEKLWSVPADDMKMGEEHIVPLSDAAIAVLDSMPKLGQYIFSMDGSKPINENAQNNRIKALSSHVVELGGAPYLDPKQNKIATAHGFRSTFKNWCTDETTYKDTVSEAALSHAVGDTSRRAYATTTQLPKRVLLMQEWADFCSKRISNVVALKGAK